jgi:hypothetical protein
VRSTVKRNVIPLQGQHLNYCTNQEFLDFSRAARSSQGSTGASLQSGLIGLIGRRIKTN